MNPIYRDRELVVYCVCPNEATAKQIAGQLNARGFHHVRPLRGGLDEWESGGYPVEPLHSTLQDPASCPSREVVMSVTS
jgi:rhodanese-related sulfurtransferase